MDVVKSTVKERPEVALIDPQEIDVEQEEFYPSGSIAFFVLMVVMFAVIWFAMYSLMLYRM